jgi:hypothetical protein
VLVRHRTAAQGEATIAPARAAGDLARLEQAHLHALLGECERAGAARHPPADDGDVDSRTGSHRAGSRAERELLARVGEPI